MYIVILNQPREIRGPFAKTPEGLAEAEDSASSLCQQYPGSKVYIFQALKSVEAGERPLIWTNL